MHQHAGNHLWRTGTGSTSRGATVAFSRGLATLDLGPKAGAAFGDAYDIELKWLAQADGVQPEVAALLAARTAASAISTEHPQAALASARMARLLAPDPSCDELQALGYDLEIMTAATAFNAADLTRMLQAWPLCAATGRLLASGGDDRLDIDPATGVNRYGCSPHPRNDVLSFGSCTASSLTPGAFAAAEAGRRAMVIAALRDDHETAIRYAGRGIEQAILQAFQSSDLADAVLTASGTDAALVVTGLLASEFPRMKLTSILVSPSETGSGVPLAVQGCHFAATSPSGQKVAKGTPVAGLDLRPSLVTIELRDAAGCPYSDEALVRACDDAISGAMLHGRVVLHAIDGSKTGLTAPARNALLDFARKYGSRLDVVIDACQARVEPALIRAYLEQGFPVLVTGSKFFGAPGFCGAVLFPRERLARIRSAGGLPVGLAAYTGTDGAFASRLCPGLLLRWTAALHEMEKFAALPGHEVDRRLDALGETILAGLRRNDRFSVVAAPRPEGPLWSGRRSVYTFAVKGDGGLLSPGTLRGFYRILQDDLSGTELGRIDPALAAARCQIGQPVQLGNPDLGGLRIAISASQISETKDHAASLMCVLEKLRLLLKDGVPY